MSTSSSDSDHSQEAWGTSHRLTSRKEQTERTAMENQFKEQNCEFVTSRDSLECKAWQKKHLWWLPLFLRKSFFQECQYEDHKLKSSKINRYCINCDLAVCKYCILLGSHEKHKLLKIYRNIYKDVVPLEEIKEHIRCKEIQRYKCNDREVIALNPLPHCGSGESSKEKSCLFCNRKLLGPSKYKYCSIACKFGIKGDSASTRKVAAENNAATKAAMEDNCKKKKKKPSTSEFIAENIDEQDTKDPINYRKRPWKANKPQRAPLS